jgi:hypothetical protein
VGFTCNWTNGLVIFLFILVFFYPKNFTAQAALSEEDSLFYYTNFNLIPSEERFLVTFYDGKIEHLITVEALSAIESKRDNNEAIEIWLNDFTQVILPSRKQLIFKLSEKSK